MDTQKQRTGRYKRMEAIRGERRKQRQKKRLATLLIVGGSVLIVVTIIIILALNRNKTTTSRATPIAITPISRPQTNGLAMGNPNATVRLDVWEDFQCPMCAEYSLNIESKLIASHIAPGTVYYVFHQFPFIDSKVGGKESAQAANASMCANEQGRFWDYHDMLFTNWNGEGKGTFTDDRLVAFAEMLGLDMNAFKSCFTANKYSAQIQKDIQAGQTMGVNGTPSIYVNKVLVTPGKVPTYDQLVEAINNALANK